MTVQKKSLIHYTVKGCNNMKAVICGYQGIGKSTLASKDLRYIDLDTQGKEE